MSAYQQWTADWWADVEAKYRGYYPNDPFALSYASMVALVNRIGINERRTSGRGMVDDMMQHAVAPELEDDGWGDVKAKETGAV